MPILVGTASWTDKSLIGCGRFYPREASSAEARLRYYASQFTMVEVDSSYYAMPSATNSRAPRSTSQPTCAPVAPTAIRTPNSLVRRATA